MDRHLALFLDVFAAGALSFGGLAAVLSSLQTSVVGHRLISAEDFSRNYSLAVGAPGPNSIFLSLLGYQVAGLPGVLIANLAWSIPTITMMYYIGRTGSSRAAPWIKRSRKALVPVIAGLLVAGAIATSNSFRLPGPQWGLTFLALGVLLVRPKWNPIWTVAACAVLGAAFIR
jgi:chromate transporter